MILNGKGFSAGLFAAAMCLLGAVSGCRSDAYYQDRAVQRAREYLLEHAPELNAEQIYFVKFNRPVLLTGPILGPDTGNGGVAGIQKQICVTWRIPGREDDYLVYGSSSGRMDFWYPNRLVRKKFSSFSIPLNAALGLARKYLQDNLYSSFSVEEFNQVRFAFPYVLKTDFTLVADPDGVLSGDQLRLAEKGLAASQQFSLVWKLGDSGESAVFCGTSQPDLGGWIINFAGKKKNSEVEAATLEIVKTPEDAQTPIVPPQAKTDDAAAGKEL